MTYLIDTHSHINMIETDNMQTIIDNAKKAGVGKIIVPSVDKNSFKKVIKLSNEYENVYGALGIHPTEAKNSKDEDFEKILTLATSKEGEKKIVAIGECGLDYYWDKEFVAEQKVVFLKQIEIAKTLKKALIVHDREAHQDTFDMLAGNVKGEINVVMHCFSGSYELAKECVKKGFYIGICGVVTFKNAKKLHEIAKNIPIEHIVLETDAPYLTPVPFRGKQNEPAYVRYVAEEIAKIREISYVEVASVTTANARRVFGI